MYHEVRPWGEFFVLDEQPGFKVKRLRVKDGGRLSLQSHNHRSEHWTVVVGIATVTIGNNILKLSRGGTISISVGELHRLESLDGGTVEIIEVQFGDYLGEDDILRYDDVYQRS